MLRNGAKLPTTSVSRMAKMVSAVSAVNGGSNSASSKNPAYSIRALKQWSVSKNFLPDVSAITNIHVYDFDNTLFASPLPNRKLWAPPSIGLLQGKDVFMDGGWWHDPMVLAMTGEGVDKEELRGWQGWWNEKIVDLVKLSMQQEDALTVLLTGRSQETFAPLIQRMVNSRSLEFDLLCLKPDVGPSGEAFTSTMKYKQALLSTLIQAYPNADEMRIYEDRPGHVEQFRSFFTQINSKYPLDPSSPSQEPRKKPINCEVVEVPSLDTSLDPEVELLRVRDMCRVHNDSVRTGINPVKNTKTYVVKKNVFFTAYIISPEDGERLLKLADLGTYKTRDNYLRFANSIIITARANIPENVMQKTGGLKAKLRWRVIALGNYDKKVFAARVEPVPIKSSFYVEANVPHVVLATVGPHVRSADANRIQTWSRLPDEDQIEFDTVVGEKATLRLEQESSANAATNTNGKRPSDNYSNIPSLGHKEHRRQSGNQNQRGSHGDSSGRGQGKGGKQGKQGKQPPRGPANAGKKGGRGNFANYRSLDDVGAGGGGTGGFGGDGQNDGGLSY